MEWWEWVRENWFFILILAIFIGMHLFGGGCGPGHGGHGRRDEKDEGHRGHNGDASREKKGGNGCC